MKLVRTWWSLLRFMWMRVFASFPVIIAIIMFYPAGWTDTGRLAARNGYFAGLASRLTDLVLWKTALVAGAACSVLAAVLVVLAYHFSLLAGSFGRKSR